MLVETPWMAGAMPTRGSSTDGRYTVMTCAESGTRDADAERLIAELAVNAKERRRPDALMWHAEHHPL